MKQTPETPPPSPPKELLMPSITSKITNENTAAAVAATAEAATATPHRLAPPTYYEDDCLLTPQSHNRGGGLSSSMDELHSNEESVEVLVNAMAVANNEDAVIPSLMILSGGGDRSNSSSNNIIHPNHSNPNKDIIVCEERNGSEDMMDNDNYSEEHVLKSYNRKLSALSGSTPTSGNSADSFDDELHLRLRHNHHHHQNQSSLLTSPTSMTDDNIEILNDDYDTPRFSSSLSSMENKDRLQRQQVQPDPEMMILTMDDPIDIKGVESSGDHSSELDSTGVLSGATSRAVIVVGDDEVTETSFTTMTTVGGGDSMTMMMVGEFGGLQLLHPPLSSPPALVEQQIHRQQLQQQQQQYLQQRTSLPSLLLSSRRGGGSGGGAGGNGVRSPRPSRRMRAVDWCPNAISGGSGGSLPSSDKTAASTRAVRLGDDATVTTFATMTTMGDAGSTTLLLEGEIEDGTTATSDDDMMLQEGEDEDEELDEEKEENHSMLLEDVKEENIVGDFVVDKIPRSSYKKKLRTQQLISSTTGKSKQTSSSGATNRAVRGSMLDDQYSVVTFATMTTTGGGGGGMSMVDDNAQDVVDKVPSLLATTDSTSIVTNESVLMGDNQSLMTWATTNTMGGQLTGNVIDNVPASMGAATTLSRSSTNLTIGTSYAVRDESSVMTFTTAAADDISEINEMVDKIPTFAGGRGSGRSIASGMTSQAVLERKMMFPGGDDRSVTSFATMTTMGDLGSIVETAEDLEDDDAEISNSFLQLRPRVFLNHDFDRRSAVVDVIPEAASSVASDTTNHSIGASVTTFGTMTTAGGRAEQNITISNEDYDTGMVDRVPNFPVDGGASVRSGTTNHAVRSNDDQSVATWLTTTTSGNAALLGGNMNDHIIDKIPALNEEGRAGAKEDYDQSEGGDTNQAVKDAEDQSVVTWNTMTTTNIGDGNDIPGPFAVDRLPSFSNRWSASAGTSMSGTTNQAVRAGGVDDQSMVTFTTATTLGMDRSASNMVDKVPSFASPHIGATSIITNETVQLGDTQSLMTWATTNTMGGMFAGNMVDHVPEADMAASEDAVIDEEDVTLGTTNAVKEDPSVTTFTTSATSGGGVSCINEVVDRVPIFAGGSGQSITSGITNQAVRMGDDRSLASFATMTTTGYDPGSMYELANSNNRLRSSNDDQIVDQIPSSDTSILSVRTDYAIQLGDDSTEATFTTITTVTGDGGKSAGKCPNSDQIVDQLPSSTTSVLSQKTTDAVRSGDDLTEATFASMTSAVGDEGPTAAHANIVESNDVSSRGTSLTRSLSMTAPPTTGILRESRHGRPPSAFRSPFETVPVEPSELPIDVGESVSNTHILRAIADLRFHVDYRIGDLREVNRRDSERVLQIVQQEQAKRTALEAKLHSQLLLQSESMVAMELKLLRLEAKVAGRDSRRQQRRQVGVGGDMAPVSDRPPPIATTSSTPNHSDEEVDSFEELELTPRGTNRNGIGSGVFPANGGILQRGGGPANIAVVTRSGASVASAVTATSFQEGDFSQAVNDSERSDDGDIEDEGDNNDDGSTSTPTQSSRNRISNLESILLNPSQGGANNDQGLSTQAVRGDTDGMSSLPTSVTSTTVASTVVTSTTRGNESIGVIHISSQLSDENIPHDEVVEVSGTALRSHSEESIESASRSEMARPRSRSQSPLTVQSANTVTQSLASASLGPSILSTAAVAPSRSFGTRRAHAAVANAEGTRSMANRVVSFTTNDLAVGTQSSTLPMQEHDGGGCDSITMPDELDNFSDVADAFSNSSRAWREEYEARLDAIQKRLGN